MHTYLHAVANLPECLRPEMYAFRFHALLKRGRPSKKVETWGKVTPLD
jgi:hypothetical protein